MKIAMLSARPAKKLHCDSNVCDENIAFAIGARDLISVDSPLDDLLFYDGYFFQSTKNPLKDLEYLKAIKSRWPEKPIFCRQEGEYEIMQYQSPANQILYFEMISKYIDLFMAHNESDAEYFKLFTNKPVFVVETIMNTNVYDSYFIPYEKREKVVCLGYDMTRMENGLVAYSIMRNYFPDFKIFHLMRGRDNSEYSYQFLKYFGHYCDVITFKSWYDVLGIINKSLACLHITHRVAGGRFIIDMAGLGVPTIASNRFDVQNKLFPSLSVDVHMIKTVVEKLTMVLRHTDFANEASKYARDHFRKYDSQSNINNVREKITRLGFNL